MAEMGVNSLKANLTNPQRVYLWEVIFPSVPGGGDIGTLSIRATSTSIPGRSVGEINIPYKQTGGFKVAGKLTYTHTWDVTFREGEDKAIHDILHAWNQLIVHDFDGIGSVDSAYKVDILFNLTKRDQSISRTVKLVGAYIQDIGDVAVSYDDEGDLTYTVTFSYDYWEDVT
jgi:hypothetical protein